MLRRILFLLLLALPCHSGLAAEPASDTATDEATTAESEASGDADDSQDAEQPETTGSLDGEGFVPSVQISEDLSVSFPTDI